MTPTFSRKSFADVLYCMRKTLNCINLFGYH